MSNSIKPGGGNKPQPFIPAGNGEKSGEYTNKANLVNQENIVHDCYIKNVKSSYNFHHSKLVQKVFTIFINRQNGSIKKYGKPNSVIKKEIDGYIVSERYYNSKGEVYLDIDYTCHGNPKKHPYVPHIHRWVKNNFGILERCKLEVFQ